MAAHTLEQERRVAAREGHPQQQLADIVEQAGQVGLGRAGKVHGHRNLVGEQGAQVAVVPEPVDGEQAVRFHPAEDLLHRDADRQVAHRVHSQVDDRLLQVGEGPGRTHGGGVDQLQDLGADGRVLVDDAGDGLQADVRVVTAVDELHEHLRHARQAAGDAQGVEGVERCIHNGVTGRSEEDGRGRPRLIRAAAQALAKFHGKGAVAILSAFLRRSNSKKPAPPRRRNIA